MLARHGGRLVKLTGDGALVEFASASRCAERCYRVSASHGRGQPRPASRIPLSSFRMGLHLRETLIVDGDDLYGDGVNVAARLEGGKLSGRWHPDFAQRSRCRCPGEVTSEHSTIWAAYR